MTFTYFMFDFKKYHYRSINAKDLNERLAINQELKAYYASLPEEEKEIFNQQLDAYIKTETEKYQSVMQQAQSEN
jgi:hypothetical protein